MSGEGRRIENVIAFGNQRRKKLLLTVAESPGSVSHDVYGNEGKVLTCGLCSEKVDVNEKGEPFIACDNCVFPVCRRCFDFICRHEGGKCPGCGTTYGTSSPEDGDGDDGDGDGVQGASTADGRKKEAASASQGKDGQQTSAADSRRVRKDAKGATSVAEEGGRKKDQHGDGHGDGESPRQRGRMAVGSQGQRQRSALSSSMDSESSMNVPLLSQTNADARKPQNNKHSSSPLAATEPESLRLSVQVGAQSASDAGTASKSDLWEYGYGSVHWNAAMVASASSGETRAPAASGGKGGGDGGGGHDDGKLRIDISDDVPMLDGTRRPLARKMHMASALVNPFRLVLTCRVLILALFLRYRIAHQNHEAHLVWLVSVICEFWFALSWILDQVPRWSPITRETYPERLSLRYEKPGEPNNLLPVDVFVFVPEVDDDVNNNVGPLRLANSILSVLAGNYPADRLSCYVSDDSASLLTFEVLTETASFARVWVPFCKKFDIEPRSPEVYFGQRVDRTAGKTHPDFVKDRRFMKTEHDEFKVRLNAMAAKFKDVPANGWTMRDGSPWPGNKSKDHAGMIQVFVQPDGETKDVLGNPLPRLVYVSRERRPKFLDHRKAGSLNAVARASALLSNGTFILVLDAGDVINNSLAIREGVCFLLDPSKGGRVCFVQFSCQPPDSLDPFGCGRRLFYEGTMRALDGVQGPLYVGTGCMFRRQALYGMDPPPVPKADKGRSGGSCCCGGGGGVCGCFGWRRYGAPTVGTGPEKRSIITAVIPGDLRNEGEVPTKWHGRRFGICPNFVITTLDAEGAIPDIPPQQVLGDVIFCISCGYEDGTEWGKKAGWRYGSTAESFLTGFELHLSGWRSVYCHSRPTNPAIRVGPEVTMVHRLHQIRFDALGSLDMFFSRHNPLWKGLFRRLKPLQRIAYIGMVSYPLVSMPILVYCCLPAFCLFTDQFILDPVDVEAIAMYVLLGASTIGICVLEARWSGVSVSDTWHNQQLWMISGLSSHLAAVVQGLLKVLTGIDTRPTTRPSGYGYGDGAAADAAASALKLPWFSAPPIVILAVTVIACLTAIAREVNRKNQKWANLVHRLLFALWVLAHLLHFGKVVLGKREKFPTLIIVWSVLFAIILSLLWVRLLA